MREWLMAFCLLILGAFGAGAADARALATIKPAMECAALAQSDVAPPGEAPARIVTAQIVTAGQVGPYCEVRGYVAPQVRFELRLPTQNWMQRLMFVGCGGFCGRVDMRIRAAEGCATIDNGEVALVTSDLGHDAPDGNGDTVWAAGNRQGQIDYGYRAVHVVTVTAKAIIARFYGQPQRYAYFNGCSDGGREAMMEVQRYAADFDGVIAGASVIHDTVNNSLYHAWSARHLRNVDGSRVFTKADLGILHAAALASCDTTGDGVRDGVIGDPAACRFDPGTVQCVSAEQKGCLTVSQVAAARALYGGPTTPDGRRLYFGRPLGSELVWEDIDAATYVKGFATYMAAPTPQPYDLWGMTFDDATLARFNGNAAIYNATDPDLTRFADKGGKLIMWHGWADWGVPPMSSVDYYKRVRDAMGARTDSFLRLFMLPGVGHCGGGDGPDRLNLVDAIMAWVEDGKAPDMVTATLKSYGRVVRARPLYPYPATAMYTGKGDSDAVASFARNR